MSHCCQSLTLEQRQLAAAVRLTCGPGCCVRELLSRPPARRDADVALRCAWLRVHAEQLEPVDPTGQLSAQLLDFADLLEVAQTRGWFA